MRPMDANLSSEGPGGDGQNRLITPSDIPLLLSAVAAAVGALTEPPVPVWVGLAVLGSGLVLRRAGMRLVILGVGLALLVGARGHQARLGLASPEPGLFTGEVVLLGDPEPAGQGVRVLVRIGSHRVEAWARGPAAWDLERLLAGERIAVAGHLGPVTVAGPIRDWLDLRHVSGRLAVARVLGPPTVGVWPTRVANGLRRNLERGASVLDPETRSLFTGLVLGDDRYQGPVAVDDFRGAGLGHLLAVSGQNVAFVLALVRPLLHRLSLIPRFASLLGTLAFFALLTRFEPSVLRATVMAGIAAGVATIGSRTSRLRLLALTTTIILVVDPFLVRSLAFQLSVGAAFGIVAFAPTITARLPGPEPFAAAIGVTLAAQLGVAPIVLPVFGSLPLVALPANLAAAPVAGPVMAWGLTGGMLAGIAPPWLAALLALPTRIGVGWIAGVARVASASGLGDVHQGQLVAGMVVGGVTGVIVRWFADSGVGRVVPRGVGFGVGAVTVVALVLAANRAASDPAITADGLQVWDGDAVVVVLDDEQGPAASLAAIRRRRIGRIDLVVSTSGSRAHGLVIDALAARHDLRAVVAPSGHRIGRATTLDPPRDLIIGDVYLRFESTADLGTVRVEMTALGDSSSGVKRGGRER